MRNRRTGLTLIEVIVATLLFSLCILFISRLLTQSFKSFRKFKTEAQVKRATDSILDQISSEVRAAHRIETADPRNIVFYRYFSDGSEYKVQYRFLAAEKKVERRWWLVGQESSVNGSDTMGVEVDDFKLTYTNDVSDPTFKALVGAEVISGQDLGAVRKYATATESKRRVVKRADNVSVTTE